MEQHHKYLVVAILLAKAKESVLYSVWYCTSLTSYITVAEVVVCYDEGHEESTHELKIGK